MHHYHDFELGALIATPPKAPEGEVIIADYIQPYLVFNGSVIG